MTNIALERALALVADGTLSIDRDGHIWRHRAIVHGKSVAVPPRRAESVGGKGYLRVMLQIDGKLCGVGAHRVVWSCLNGPIPRGRQINHVDSNKQNNNPTNLELVTGSENIRHSYAAGRVRPWSRGAAEWRPGRKRLTPIQISRARKMRERGALIREIAARFGIGLTHAHRITS